MLLADRAMLWITGSLSAQLMPGTWWDLSHHSLTMLAIPSSGVAFLKVLEISAFPLGMCVIRAVEMLCVCS